MAEAINDFHRVLSIIADHATELIPGEAVDEPKRAWAASGDSLQGLAVGLLVGLTSAG